jgi:hypothetical protein
MLKSQIRHVPGAEVVEWLTTLHSTRRSGVRSSHHPTLAPKEQLRKLDREDKKNPPKDNENVTLPLRVITARFNVLS